MKKANWEKIILILVSIIVGFASIIFNNVIAALLAVFCSFNAFKFDNNSQNNYFEEKIYSKKILPNN